MGQFCDVLDGPNDQSWAYGTAGALVETAPMIIWIGLHRTLFGTMLGQVKSSVMGLKAGYLNDFGEIVAGSKDSTSDVEDLKHAHFMYSLDVFTN